MFRQVKAIENDVLRVKGYITAYSPKSVFHKDMKEKLVESERELKVARKYFESLEVE
jgi:hypothetical protein